MIENEISARGDNTPHLDAALLNVTRFVPVAMKWAVEHGKPASRLATERWSATVRFKTQTNGAALRSVRRAALFFFWNGV